MGRLDESAGGHELTLLRADRSGIDRAMILPRCSLFSALLAAVTLAACTNTLRTEPGAGADAGAVLDPDIDAAAASLATISNESDFGPLAETGLRLGPPNGVFDTDNDCIASSPLGQCAPVALASDRPDACVCRVDEIVIGRELVLGNRGPFAVGQHPALGEDHTGRCR